MTIESVRRGILAATLMSGMAASLSAQGGLADTIQEIRSASEAGRHGEALRLAAALERRFPDHPSVVLTHATALAEADSIDASARKVRRLLRWDARYAEVALSRDVLAAVRERFDMADVSRRAAADALPIARGRAWAVIDERDLVAEGVAWDPATRSVLVGSLHKGGVVAVAADGAVSDRVERGAHGLTSIAGIHVDTVRSVLWVTNNARYDDPADTTRSALLGFDAPTGAFRRRVELREPGRHFLNDLTTAPDGTVYVTDSRAGRVLALRPGARDFEELSVGVEFHGANGITMAGDRSLLFVANDDHIRAVRLANGASWRLAVPDSVNVSGIDGLAYAQGSLIAHHPLSYWRIARYRLDDAHRAVVGHELIESNTPDARTSTAGEVVGSEYVYLGNGQLDRMNEGTIDPATMDPIRMYRIGLGPPAPEVVLVSLSGMDSVAVLDAETLARTGTLPVGRAPHEIALSPDGRRAYVANTADPTITVIEAGADPGVGATWPLPDSITVHDLAVLAGGDRVWAVAAPRQLALELDARTGSVLRRVHLDRAGGWMIEPEGPDGTLVIANLEGAAVTLLDPVTGDQRILAAREGEIDAASTPDGGEVWSVNLAEGTLTAYDPTTGEVVGREHGLPGATRVVFSPDGRTAYVVAAGDSSLVAFDVPTKRERAPVTVPGGPKVLAISRDGRRGYLTHPERGAVTLIDLPAMSVLHTTALDGTPDGIAVVR